MQKSQREDNQFDTLPLPLRKMDVYQRKEFAGGAVRMSVKRKSL
jgi:hypothetical protein